MSAGDSGPPRDPSPVRTGLILAAGKGTRLLPLTRDVPKPLLRLHGKPLLQYIVEGLARAGCTDLVVVVGYLQAQVREYFGDGRQFGAHVRYLEQEEQGGTGDAVLLARDVEGFRRGPFVVTYGDILCSYWAYESLAALAREGVSHALVANHVPDPHAGAAVYATAGGVVERIVEKPPRGTSTTQWNNAGIYLLGPDAFEWLARTPVSSRGELELTQALQRGIETGNPFRVVHLDATRFWCDVGTPEEYHALQTRRDWLHHMGGNP